MSNQISTIKQQARDLGYSITKNDRNGSEWKYNDQTARVTALVNAAQAHFSGPRAEYDAFHAVGDAYTEGHIARLRELGEGGIQFIEPVED